MTDGKEVRSLSPNERTSILSRRLSKIVSPIAKKFDGRERINSIISNLSHNIKSGESKTLREVIQKTDKEISKRMRNQLFQEAKKKFKKTRFSKLCFPTFTSKQRATITPSPVGRESWLRPMHQDQNLATKRMTVKKEPTYFLNIDDRKVVNQEIKEEEEEEAEKLK